MLVVTFILTGADVAVVPLLSVATAITMFVPTAALVQRK